MNTLHLVSAANSRFFSGLLVALTSALASASGRYNYEVHVLDGGLSDQELELLGRKLELIAAQKGIGVALKRLVPPEALLARLPIRRGSYLTYARLIVPSILDVDRFIYLDSDVLCLAGVEMFWEAFDETSVITAVLDPLKVIRRDHDASKRLPRSERRSGYFNAGVIGLNAALWRGSAQAAEIDAMMEKAQGFKLGDQTMLNIVFHKNWREVPGSGNYVLTIHNCSALASMDGPANYHYVGPHKPWFDKPSIFQRHAANTLFDKACEWAGGPVKLQRTVDRLSLDVAIRKSRIYRFFQPGRAREYAGAVASVENAEAIAARIWSDYGFKPLPE
jgi:lipopolysaccharide biosynthesis glycosyltransferase